MGTKFVAMAFLIAAGTSVSMADVVFAQDQATPAATDATKDTSKRVCRSVTPTGSRFAQRVCKTRAQWETDAEKAQRLLEDNLKRQISPPAEGGYGL